MSDGGFDSGGKGGGGKAKRDGGLWDGVRSFGSAVLEGFAGGASAPGRPSARRQDPVAANERPAAMRQIHRSMKAWRDEQADAGVAGASGAEARQNDNEVAAADDSAESAAAEGDQQGDGATAETEAKAHGADKAAEGSEAVEDGKEAESREGPAEPEPEAKTLSVAAKLKGVWRKIYRSGGDKPPPQGLGYYRGGAGFAPKPGEYKTKTITKDGKQVKVVATTHGVSLYNNPDRVKKWGAFAVTGLPPTLKIIQRGGDPEHFEIVPAQEGMTEEAYAAALAGVGAAAYQEPKK